MSSVFCNPANGWPSSIMTHIAVLGAGIIGMTSAYALHKQGYQVTVVDRQPAAARECSYANGGQLSYSHMEPWANPHILSRLPSWLIDANSPLSFGKLWDRQLWVWLTRFVMACRSHKVQATTAQLLELAMQSRESLLKMQKETGIEANVTHEGIMHVFSQSRFFESNRRHVAYQQSLGCRAEILSGNEAVLSKEPALSRGKHPFAGGIYFPDDGSGNVHVFTEQLGHYLSQQGVEFRYGVDVACKPMSGRMCCINQKDNQRIDADAYVVASGAYSRDILRAVGVDIPLYPLKGYSISLPLDGVESAPRMGITDQSNKLVFSVLGNRLRAAGMADFSGYCHAIRSKRIQTLKHLTSDLFPAIETTSAVHEWACLRPSTPTGIPIIGKTSLDNVYVNTGHGSLGWTLAAGSADRLVASFKES